MTHKAIVAIVCCHRWVMWLCVHSYVQSIYLDLNVILFLMSCYKQHASTIMMMMTTATTNRCCKFHCVYCCRHLYYTSQSDIAQSLTSICICTFCSPFACSIYAHIRYTDISRVRHRIRGVSSEMRRRKKEKVTTQTGVTPISCRRL